MATGSNFESSANVRSKRPVIESNNMSKIVGNVQESLTNSEMSKKQRVNSNSHKRESKWTTRLYNGGVTWTNTVSIECAIEGLPYNEMDILNALGGIINPKNVRYIGTVGVRYIYSVGLADKMSMDTLLQVGSVTVKGKQADIYPITKSRTTLFVKWITPEMPNSIITEGLNNYGKIISMEQEKVRFPGCEHVLTTTRRVIMELGDGITEDDLPYMIRSKGRRFAIVIPGRPPVCFKCKQRGHIRKNCPLPSCSICNRTGHTTADCDSSSYAAKLRKLQSENDLFEWEMDELDGENDTSLATTDAPPPTRNHIEETAQMEVVIDNISSENQVPPSITTITEDETNVVAKDHPFQDSNELPGRIILANTVPTTPINTNSQQKEEVTEIKHDETSSTAENCIVSACSDSNNTVVPPLPEIPPALDWSDSVTFESKGTKWHFRKKNAPNLNTARNTRGHGKRPYEKELPVTPGQCDALPDDVDA